MALQRIEDHSIEQMELAIQRLPTIHAARVILDETNSRIDKVHVMAARGNSAKKIVRDIETLLILNFNQRIDYRKISLVYGDPDEYTLFQRARLRLTAVEVRDHEQETRVLISLAGPTETFLGSADGPALEDNTLLATRATLDALHHAVPDVQIEHTATRRLTIENDTILLVVLHLRSDNGEERLIGSAFDVGNPPLAAARATLDALNRKLFTA